jgi:glycosyltransferase involved in cell wall biosynthesis
MTSQQPIMIDATTMYRWRDLAPVGIIRLERLLAAHLRYSAGVGPAEYVLWDGGYRPATALEHARIDRLLAAIGDAASDSDAAKPEANGDTTTKLHAARGRRSIKSMTRSQGLRAISRIPDHLRPFAEQAAWSAATLVVESVRHIKRARSDRDIGLPVTITSPSVRHRVDFTRGGDLIAFGLGWEYIDHEAMYRIAHEHRIRVHMPAFDLIAMDMPQMNAGQAHLVHRYYAEMAHYADSITSISHATEQSLRDFYEREGLPIPFLATNQLPGFAPTRPSGAPTNRRRHRLEGRDFILTVSTIEVRKNHLLLAKLWVDFARQGLPIPHLAIVGKLGWDINELFQWVAHAPELHDYVTFYNDVEDDELVEMYRDCLFTVFPSRIEGWGLPITESLSYGKVCVHADDPAQFEASQGLMPHHHPDDYLGWRNEIERLVLDKAHRMQLEQTIAERFVLRTPDDYCREFASILATRRREDA